MEFRRTRQPTGPTSVYIVTCVDRIKIGIAKDVHARVIDLQFVCPFAVAIVGSREFPTRERAMLAERTLHARFAEQRIHGEWFVMDGKEAYAALTELTQLLPVKIRGRLRSRQPGVPFGDNEPHSFEAAPAA